MIRVRTREEVLEDAQRLRRLTPEYIESYELPPIPSAEEVRARVADYQQRVEALFRQIEEWVAEDGRYTARRSGSDFVFERYMAYHDLPEAEVPVLSLYAQDGTEVLRFRPNAIWLVPTNGRIVIETPNVPIRQRLHDLRLLDNAQPFQRSDWTLWGTPQVKFDERFDRESLLRLVEEQHGAIR